MAQKIERLVWMKISFDPGRNGGHMPSRLGGRSIVEVRQADTVYNFFVHLSCVVCVCFPACAHQNVQQCVHKPVFAVLHSLNMQAHTCTCMRV